MNSQIILSIILEAQANPAIIPTNDGVTYSISIPQYSVDTGKPVAPIIHTFAVADFQSLMTLLNNFQQANPIPAPQPNPQPSIQAQA